MLEYKLGYFATSLCGHDKGKVYMIVKQEGEMIGLSDGGRRTIDNPKWKKKKHIQMIRRMPIRGSVMRSLEWKGVK